MSVYTAGHVLRIRRLGAAFLQGGVLHTCGLPRPLPGSCGEFQGSNHSSWVFLLRNVMHCCVANTFRLMLGEGHG